MPPRHTVRLGSVAMRLAALVAAAMIVPLAVGCGATQPGHYRPTAGTCFSFGVRAIQQQLIVTHVPRACAGLSNEQLNTALARAVRAAVGPRHKAAERQAAEHESKYLEDLFTTVPPPSPEPLSAGPQQPSADQPLQLAALGAWLATAAAGGYILVRWLAAGRRRGTRRHASRGAPRILIAHASLAISGLGIWTAFLTAGIAILAWLAVGFILVVAGLGMAALVTGLPEPQAREPGRPAAQVLAAGLHGALATLAILLVLLAAVGAG